MGNASAGSGAPAPPRTGVAAPPAVTVGLATASGFGALTWLTDGSAPSMTPPAPPGLYLRPTNSL